MDIGIFTSREMCWLNFKTFFNYLKDKSAQMQKYIRGTNCISESQEVEGMKQTHPSLFSEIVFYIVL